MTTSTLNADLKSVALIEDDDIYASYLRKTVLPSEVHVTVFPALSLAIESFKTDQPDVILLDLKLPDKPWPDSLGAVVAACPESAVIVITGDANDDDGVQAMRMGAQDYFPKSQLSAENFYMSMVLAFERAQRFAKIDGALKEALDNAASRSSSSSK